MDQQLRETLKAIEALDKLSTDLTIITLVIYFVLSVLIAIAATKRGRGPVAWFLSAFLLSPVMAGILLLLFPVRKDDPHSVDDKALRASVRRQNRQRLAFIVTHRPRSRSSSRVSWFEAPGRAFPALFFALPQPAQISRRQIPVMFTAAASLCRIKQFGTSRQSSKSLQFAHSEFVRGIPGLFVVAHNG